MKFSHCGKERLWSKTPPTHPPAHLQRLLRRLANNHQSTLSVAAALRSAVSLVEDEAVNKPLGEGVALSDIPVFDFGKRRTGPLRRHTW